MHQCFLMIIIILYSYSRKCVKMSRKCIIHTQLSAVCSSKYPLIYLGGFIRIWAIYWLYCPFCTLMQKPAKQFLDEKYNIKRYPVPGTRYPVPGTGTPVFRIRANSHNFAVSDTTKHFVDAIEIEQHF